MLSLRTESIRKVSVIFELQKTSTVESSFGFVGSHEFGWVAYVLPCFVCVCEGEWVFGEDHVRNLSSILCHYILTRSPLTQVLGRWWFCLHFCETKQPTLSSLVTIGGWPLVYQLQDFFQEQYSAKPTKVTLRLLQLWPRVAQGKWETSHWIHYNRIRSLNRM